MKPFDDRQNVLLSFHYWGKRNVSQDVERLWVGSHYPRVVLDSGAWSAYTQKKPMNMAAYMAFIRRHLGLWWWYSNLDDMTSWQKSMDNMKVMEDAGLAPVPVFHTGEPWHVLEHYAENYPRIAVGKIVPYTIRPKVIVPWLKKVFQIAGHRAIHGFGVTNVNLMKMFPFDSTDSSSWTAAVRYGNVRLWSRPHGTLKTAKARTPMDYNRHRPLLDEHGYKDFNFYHMKTAATIRIPMGAVCVVGYCKMQSYLRESINPAISMCLAGAGPGDLISTAWGMRWFFDNEVPRETI